MNRFCFLIRLPVHPSPNSATLYTDLQKIHIVARVRAIKNPLKPVEERRVINAGFWSNAAEPRDLYRERVRIAKSTQRIMKINKVKTWNARPATMMLSPVSGDLLEWAAADAKPPPAACRRRDMRSHGMNCSTISLCLKGWMRMARAYNSSISLRTNPWIFRSKCIHDSSQAQIDPSSYEGWRNGQTNYLHEKSILFPLILPTHYTTRISDDFKYDTNAQGECERRCSTSECICENKSEEWDAKKSEKNRICADWYTIEIIWCRNGTGIDCTTRICIEFISRKKRKEGIHGADGLSWYNDGRPRKKTRGNEQVKGWKGWKA